MLSGREDKADELWNFAMESRSYVEEQLSDISEDERVRVFIANENMKNITSETKSVKLDFGGQLYTDAAQEANWQDYLRGADISKKAQA